MACLVYSGQGHSCLSFRSKTLKSNLWDMIVFLVFTFYTLVLRDYAETKLSQKQLRLLDAIVWVVILIIVMNGYK